MEMCVIHIVDVARCNAESLLSEPIYSDTSMILITDLFEQQKNTLESYRWTNIDITIDKGKLSVS